MKLGHTCTRICTSCHVPHSQPIQCCTPTVPATHGELGNNMDSESSAVPADMQQSPQVQPAAKLGYSAAAVPSESLAAFADTLSTQQKQQELTMGYSLAAAHWESSAVAAALPQTLQVQPAAGAVEQGDSAAACPCKSSAGTADCQTLWGLSRGSLHWWSVFCWQLNPQQSLLTHY